MMSVRTVQLTFAAGVFVVIQNSFTIKMRKVFLGKNMVRRSVADDTLIQAKHRS